eukprot:COSAG01_NODE_3132_length_6532_cov_6.151873_1_plen_181_part_00
MAARGANTAAVGDTVANILRERGSRGWSGRWAEALRSAASGAWASAGAQLGWLAGRVAVARWRWRLRYRRRPSCRCCCCHIRCWSCLCYFFRCCRCCGDVDGGAQSAANNHGRGCNEHGVIFGRTQSLAAVLGRPRRSAGVRDTIRQLGSSRRRPPQPATHSCSAMHHTRVTLVHYQYKL